MKITISVLIILDFLERAKACESPPGADGREPETALHVFTFSR